MTAFLFWKAYAVPVSEVLSIEAFPGLGDEGPAISIMFRSEDEWTIGPEDPLPIVENAEGALHRVFEQFQVMVDDAEEQRLAREEEAAGR